MGHNPDVKCHSFWWHRSRASVIPCPRLAGEYIRLPAFLMMFAAATPGFAVPLQYP
jgi:hypothetical protein